MLEQLRWRKPIPTDRQNAVLRLGIDDVTEVVDVLCEAFFDYPVMRYVVGADEHDYARRLGVLIHFFVMARVFRGEILLGIRDRSGLGGVALVSRPDGSQSPPDMAALRERVWADLGQPAHARYMEFGEVWAPLTVEVPHLHLNMIGVRRSAQGRGCGRAMIEHIHLLSQGDPDSAGVTLTTEDEAKVGLYEHLGYQVIGQATLGPGLRTWGFFRPDQPLA